MTASHRRILVVDDNPKIHEDFCKILSPRSAPSQLLQAEAELFGTAEPVDGSLDFEIHSAYQGDRALPLVKRAVENGTPFAVAFVDIRMPPGLNGVETARELWSIDPRLQLVLCTAYSDYSWEEMVAELGARGGFLILKKPFDSIEVRQLARALSEKWRLLRENEAHLLSLEAQVRSRTDELERALERLRDEMADRLRLEKELRHAQKLEALGRLVAGIGHEVNNPLAYVMVNIDWAVSELTRAGDALAEGVAPQPSTPPRSRPARSAPPRVPEWRASKRPPSEGGADAPQDGVIATLFAVRDALVEAASGAERIRRIVNSAREFSRPREEAPTAVDLSGCFEGALRIVGNEIRHRARLVVAFADTPPVLADPHRLEQVFVNLLMNALQALPEDGANQEIVVTTEVRDPERVLLTIRDTGTGIAEADLEHVFEPFFSTRPVGQGTGLGLWICRSIIESFGGTIELESQVGHGTTARVTLTRAEASETTSGSSRPRTPSTEPGARKRARILLVDDEPAVLRGLKRALSGHDIRSTTNGREAVEIYKSEPFDLVFCDLMMPGFGGMEFLAEIEKLGPEHARRVVIMTGGVFTEPMREFVANSKNRFVPKPFDTNKLRKLVEAELHAKRPSSLRRAV
ncbi:MAG TPA: response regulator [Polyangiaceae bacterium]|nr:response regulator [Polyangiaceae bacterium]